MATMRSIFVTLAVCGLLAFVAVQARTTTHDNGVAASSPSSADWHRSIYRGVERSVGDNEPSQIRLSFVPQGMAVSWSTVAAQASMPSVAFGTSPSNLASTVQATESSTYGTLTFYTAVLQQLQSNQRYYYSVEGSATVYSFVAPKVAGDQEPFTVLVVGDMGLDNSQNTISSMNANLNSTDFFLHIGDLSYADDFYLRSDNTVGITKHGNAYEGSWNTWQDLMEPITSVAAYMSLPGNHEVTCTEVTPFLCPSYQKNMTAYRHRFRMPNEESGGTDNLWYSYDYGMAHFIQIDTETDFPHSPMGPGTYYNAGPFGDQLSWFEADLQKASEARAAGVTPWIIVSGHRPWYSSGKKCSECQDAFEKLMVQYGVDMYFSGHVHWYERLWPITLGGVVTQQDYNEPKGIVYIVNGAAGNVEGHSTGTGAAYSALIDESDYGYGKMYIANSSALNWQFFRSSDDSVADDIWIYKSH